MKPLSHLRSLVVTVALSAFAATPLSHAQLGMQAGFVEAFQPDYLNRDISIFDEVLELEEWQQTTVESLFQDYAGDFRVGVDGLRDQMKDLKDQILSAGEQGAMGVIMVPINKWSKEKARLKLRFIENLRSVLSDEQQARWPRLEMALRRDKELPKGLLSGESVNLRAVALEAGLPPDAMIAAEAALGIYEAQLDAALLARATQLAESQERLKEAMVGQDFERGLNELELIVAKRVALRDLQDRSIDSLALVFGEEWGPRFKARALATAYPAVYRASPLIGYFAAARELSGLSADQISRINDVEIAYVGWYADWQNRLAQAHRIEEPKKQTDETRRRRDQAVSRQEKPIVRDPYQPLHAERDATDEKARADIAAIIGEELARQLPGAPKLAAEAARPMISPKAGSARPDLGSDTDSPRQGPENDQKAVSRQAGGRENASSKEAPRTVE